jgi:large subunit ribosomal protein L21
MYAIVETGGKQYRVAKNDVINVEKLGVAQGKSVKLDKVLLYADGKKTEIGTPYIKGAKVTCEVVGLIRGRKSVSFKYKRRKSSRTKIGHRQSYTKVKIKEISVG